MIQILTLFLGLATGIHPLELRAAGAVTQVEIQLDGVTVTVLEGPPWSHALDLGEDLVPHRLTAIGRDEQGREIDRAHRLINLGAQAFEPLSNSDGFDFSHGQDVTAVAVEMLGRGKAPTVEEMKGWFLVQGEPARVVHVEEGPAEIIVVRDPAAQRWMEVLGEVFLQQSYGRSLPSGLSGANLGLDRDSFLALAKNSAQGASVVTLGAAWDNWRKFTQADGETELRFISPLAAPASAVEGRKQIFNISPPFETATQGVLYHAARVRPLEFELRISDAVALAGLEAHAGRKRRAVLTLLTDVPMGRSRYRPENTRHYLEKLGIPLFAWSFEEAMLEWNATPIYTGKEQSVRLTPQQSQAVLARVREAFAEIRRNLNRQRIVWLVGAHLPQDIQLSPQATGLRFAGHDMPATQVKVQP